jgi:hypothetical protein
MVARSVPDGYDDGTFIAETHDCAPAGNRPSMWANHAAPLSRGLPPPLRRP